MLFSIAITGPTASGKTALSLSLAEELKAEIVSCDSMQIYRYMNIGTAKATAEEQGRVKHHLIDFLEPDRDYSVESYREDAMRVAREISERGKTPLFVGGTGLYIDSLSRGCAMEAPESDPEYRERILKKIQSEEDIDALWQRLREIDPESAEKIHKNNVKRVIRAIEIYEKTGKPKSLLDRESKRESSEIFVGMITLDFHNRDTLYERVDRRVDMMIEEGLVEEVKELLSRGYLKDGTASQAIGYKELVAYIEGKCTLSEAAEEIKLASRRYAKRQLTWFRHETGAKTLYMDTEDGKMRRLEDIMLDARQYAEELRLEYETKKGF